MLIVSMGLVAEPAGTTLDISHRARLIAPGEVVIVAVMCEEPLTDVRVTWRGATLPFYALAGTRWEGLVPIDLSTPAGRYALAVEASTEAGHVLKHEYDLVVQRKRFPVRRLRVAPRFVEPPADVLPRIAQERDAVERVVAHVTDERLWLGGFVTPVPGPVTSDFGRQSVLNGKRRSQHSGTDLQADEGTPVIAPSRGRVVLAGDHYFSGHTVMIDHGLGVYSYLAHLSAVLAAEGDLVDQGQTVALSGSTGRVTGPHVHWSMRVGGARIDPMSLVALMADTRGADP
jgi:murein DD-endopeptidase MepM/ murein hydrolase activator NlpD